MRAYSLPLVLSLVAASLPAYAADVWTKDTGWTLKPGSDGVYQVLAEQGRPGSHTTVCSSSSCSRTGSVPGPFGNPKPTISPTSTFDKGAVARGAMGLGSRLLPWMSAGYALYDWYTASGLTVDPTGAPAAVSSNSTLKTGSWRHDLSSTPFPSPESACRDYMRRFEQSQAGTSNPVRNPVITVNPWSEGQRQCQAVFDLFMYGSWGSERLVSAMVVTSSPESWCYDDLDSPVVRPTGGLCPTGAPVPVPPAQAQTTLEQAPISPDVLRRALQEVLDAGGSISSTGTTVSGPTSAPGATRTQTTTGPGGVPVVTTVQTIYNYTYNSSQVSISQTDRTVNPDGSLSEVTTPPQELCGVPGAPACNVKVDETGTPSATSPDLSVFENLKTQDAQKVSEALSSVPEPSFGFIGAPPIVACRPVPLPNDMGEIDACNVVDTVRELMGFLWALAAAWISLGWIREAVNGG